MKSFAFLCGIVAVLPVWAQEPANHQVRVSASRLNVRDAEGEVLCSVGKGDLLSAFARHANGNRVKVRLNSKGCPGEGYVYSNYVRSVSNAGEENSVTKVEPSELALRKSPSPNGRFLCGIRKNSEVTILDKDPQNAYSEAWVRVKVSSPRPGCPDEGFVNSSYLLPTDDFAELPLAQENDGEAPGNTEAGLPCPNGNCERGKSEQNPKDMKAALPRGQRPPFLEEILKMRKNKKYKPVGFNSNRGLIQMPLEGSTDTIGACGSHHYTGGDKNRVDVYANPLTACVFTAALQKWKKDGCPEGGGCRVSWGDISHRNDPQFNGVHKTHTDGHCIDIRPLRKGGFQDRPLTYGSCRRLRSGKGRKSRTVCTHNSEYDQQKTKELVQMLVRDFGGTNEKGGRPYFNDTSVGTTSMPGHQNHIHICFKSNPKTQAACDNLSVDPAVCPELM